jgi:hypothetical protein
MAVLTTSHASKSLRPTGDRDCDTFGFVLPVHLANRAIVSAGRPPLHHGPVASNREGYP